MCEPMTIMTAVGAGLGLMQQADQARQMNAAADRQAEHIRETTVLGYEQANRKAVEDSQNAASEHSRLSRDMDSRIATANAQGGASGVTGLSVNALLMDLAGKGLEAQTTAETNYARQSAAHQDQVNEIYRSGKGQMNSVQRSAGVGLFDVVGAGLQVANAHYANKAPNTAPLGGAKNTSVGGDWKPISGAKTIAQTSLKVRK